MAERGRTFIRMALIGVACAPALAGCGTDLGECDMMALGGSDAQGMLAPRTGQLLVHNTCAGGSCHSSTATGDQRSGAPAELDFDVVPDTNSAVDVARAVSSGGNVHDEAEEMWAQIESGAMPPEGKRGALVAADKEAIRNWLACGAQVVAAPRPPMQMVPENLTSIHAALTGLTCKACHTTGSPDNAFLSGDACVMYDALVGKTSVSTGCASAKLPLVTAGKPDESLFLQKLNPAPAPPCGATMPFNATPLGTSDPVLVASIRTWIMNGAMKPAGCP